MEQPERNPKQLFITTAKGRTLLNSIKYNLTDALLKKVLVSIPKVMIERERKEIALIES